MKRAVDFVRANITIRKISFFNNPKLFNSIIFSDSIESYDSKMLENISSKSFIMNGYIVNRIKGLECLLNGINFETGERFVNFDLVKNEHPFIISCYILAGQVFSDANHRVVLEYLNSLGYSFSKSIKYVEKIDSTRRTKNLSWENIHDFIESLISNILDIKGDIELFDKLF
jgi:hypothetical protein